MGGNSSRVYTSPDSVEPTPAITPRNPKDDPFPMKMSSGSNLFKEKSNQPARRNNIPLRRRGSLPSVGMRKSLFAWLRRSSLDTGSSNNNTNNTIQPVNNNNDNNRPPIKKKRAGSYLSLESIDSKKRRSNNNNNNNLLKRGQSDATIRRGEKLYWLDGGMNHHPHHLNDNIQFQKGSWKELEVAALIAKQFTGQLRTVSYGTKKKGKVLRQSILSQSILLTSFPHPATAR